MKEEDFKNKLQKLKELANNDIGDISSEWTMSLQNEEPILISTIIAWLGYSGMRGDRFDALRDSASSILYTQFTDQLISTMKKLDKSSSNLTTVGIVLSVIIGISSILVALL